jgi:hypothetical protein
MTSVRIWWNQLEYRNFHLVLISLVIRFEKTGYVGKMARHINSFSNAVNWMTGFQNPKIPILNTEITESWPQIKERVEKFDRFVRENEVKRQRALVKFQNERKQQVRR